MHVYFISNRSFFICNINLDNFKLFINALIIYENDVIKDVYIFPDVSINENIYN